MITFNNTQIKCFIESWYIFELKIIKKRVMVKKGWEPLLYCYYYSVIPMKLVTGR